MFIKIGHFYLPSFALLSGFPNDKCAAFFQAGQAHAPTGRRWTQRLCLRLARPVPAFSRRPIGCVASRRQLSWPHRPTPAQSECRHSQTGPLPRPASGCGRPPKWARPRWKVSSPGAELADGRRLARTEFAEVFVCAS